jgi:hypothetical protein
MNGKLAKPENSYPLSPALTLRDACQKSGHDGGGRRCPVCPLKDLCESEARWLVELVSRSRLN